MPFFLLRTAHCGAPALAGAYLADAPVLDRSATATAQYRAWNAGRGDTSTGLRMNYYKTTAAVVRDHPVLGVGTGGFVIAYREKIRGTELPESNNRIASTC